MKKSTKMTIVGFTLFFVGSLAIQVYIEPIFFMGIVAMYISFLLIDAKLNEILHEGHVEELNQLRTNIDKSLEDMKKFVDSDQTQEDEEEYFNSKRSEIDKEK